MLGAPGLALDVGVPVLVVGYTVGSLSCLYGIPPLGVELSTSKLVLLVDSFNLPSPIVGMYSLDGEKTWLNLAGAPGPDVVGVPVLYLGYTVGSLSCLYGIPPPGFPSSTSRFVLATVDLSLPVPLIGLTDK